MDKMLATENVLFKNFSSLKFLQKKKKINKIFTLGIVNISVLVSYFIFEMYKGCILKIKI